MPELKHNFTKGKMNKDLDERLVPDGQYRDANNIQVSTSDGSDVGAAQSVLGNAIRNTVSDGGTFSIPTTATCVGSIAAPNRDKIYYFVSAGDRNDSENFLDIRKDYIMEYDSVLETLKYVFVDIYNVREQINVASPAGANYITIPSLSTTQQNESGVRVGMQVEGTIGTTTYTLADNVYVYDLKLVDAGGGVTNVQVYLRQDGEDIVVDGAVNDYVNFTADRVLNFYKDIIITGINVVDDFIYWTDNNFEPKRINILRSLAGTGGDKPIGGQNSDAFLSQYDNNQQANPNVLFNSDNDIYHTRLVIDKNYYTDESDQYQIATSPDTKRAVYVSEENVTVIRKAPTQPLRLDMSRDSLGRVNDDGEINDAFVELDQSFFIPNADNVYQLIEANQTITVTFESPVDYRINDYILIARQSETANIDNFNDYSIRAKVVGIPTATSNPNNLNAGPYVLEIQSINQDILETDTNWYTRVEQVDNLFEFKFVRFSYRYKYQDGEYSTFAPFSQVAFLPDRYEYEPKKGYNLGMLNQLRAIRLEYYHHNEEIIPQDVIEIDLLYKETNNPTVYKVKTIKKTDDSPMWPNLNSGQGDRRGSFEIKTDLIHSVLPANQLLRPYDNVPRVALAQEVSANRLIYGNYLQNYTVLKDPILSLGVESKTLGDFNSDFALPSVKSVRSYQIGVVFSDGYGRETPVLTSKDARIRVPKEVCNFRNRITAGLLPKHEVPSWAKYYSFYVKEPSVEYYTLAMDRWYKAEDENIWLSFPSSERNKLQEEDFLILKKGHGNDIAVHDKARYRILAIENEAPDFIKTSKRSLGTLWNENNDSIGNETRGYPLQDVTFITIKKELFEDIFGDPTEWLRTPDKLTLRLYGDNQRSEEYEVIKISPLQDHVKLKILGGFDEDAAFAGGATDTYADRVDSLAVELIEHKVVNKPEFDGRFFVKIHRDNILEQYVLNNGDIDYYVRAAWQLRYVNNNGYSNAGTANGAVSSPIPVDAKERAHNHFLGAITGVTNESDQSNVTTGDTFSRHPTRYTHHAAYYWGGAAAGDVPDNGNPPDPIYIENASLEKSPNIALNDNTLTLLGGGLEAKAAEFWAGMAGYQDFFIDGATAYSWTSKDDNRPGNYFINDDLHQDFIGYSQKADAWEQREDGAPSFNGQDHIPGNMKDGRGMPSRGVWGGGKYMDISWTGMGIGYNDSNWNDDNYPFPHQLSHVEDEEVHGAASQFIAALCTPGCKWRFRKDPFETVYTTEDFGNGSSFYGYDNSLFWKGGTTFTTGAFGIRNFRTQGLTLHKKQYYGHNMRQRWTIAVTDDQLIGSGTGGYSPTTGTAPGIEADHTVVPLHHDGSDADAIELLTPALDDTGRAHFSNNPAVWETEPRESTEVDIYYQASPLIPLYLSKDTNEEFVPIGSTFTINDNDYTVTGWNHKTINFTPNLPAGTILEPNQVIKFTKNNHYSLNLTVNTGTTGGGPVSLASTGSLDMNCEGSVAPQEQDLLPRFQTHYLDYNNCYCFGNGVESDRIRDDFNAQQMDNGVKASTVLETQVREERRKHGLIWSGIYNSSSGVNNLNQFIQAEKITKDINPVYGSIQKLYNRDTRLIMFCEDKVLRAVTNRDALYNADGNPQLVASNAVVGDVTPYQGEYGISTNPESFAASGNRMYFSDAMRGKVLTLQGDGLMSISGKGMKDYFADYLANSRELFKCLGTYDARKSEYNISMYKKTNPTDLLPRERSTVSFAELSDGWVSFKSFYPENGVSMNNDYYTFSGGQLYKHHDETVAANNFYGAQYYSDITVLFNDNPGSVKSFGTINYEGSQARVVNFDTESTSSWLTGNYSVNDGLTSNNVTDGEYYNLGGAGADSAGTQGWYVDNIMTNLQSSENIEFIEKENKWFGKITGATTSLENLDENEFSVQGLGTATITHDTTDQAETLTFTVQNSASSGGVTWDTTPD